VRADDPELRVSTPLFGGWSVTELIDDVFGIDGIEIHRAGISAERGDGRSSFGSAASLVAGEALPRARFELFERIAILEAHGDSTRESFESVDPDGTVRDPLARRQVFPVSEDPRWQHSLSNGVASGATWALACEAARRELAERDAVLRAWYSQAPPSPIEIPRDFAPPTASYVWRAFAFATSPWADDLDVVGVFGLPDRIDLPLLRGFAAASDRKASLRRAIRECVQNLAFLAEDPLPTLAPEPSPTPTFHLDAFLCPEGRERLERWLNGQCPHTRMRLPDTGASAPVAYAELTLSSAPPGHHVARAVCKGALSLTFGDGPEWVESPLRAHPIA